jgi:hypothetical protein
LPAPSSRSRTNHASGTRQARAAVPAALAHRLVGREPGQITAPKNTCEPRPGTMMQQFCRRSRCPRARPRALESTGTSRRSRAPRIRARIAFASLRTRFRSTLWYRGCARTDDTGEPISGSAPRERGHDEDALRASSMPARRIEAHVGGVRITSSTRGAALDPAPQRLASRSSGPTRDPARTNPASRARSEDCLQRVARRVALRGRAALQACSVQKTLRQGGT